MAARFPSDSKTGELLGQPLKFAFSERTAPNRVLKAAMTERLSSWHPEEVEKSGVPTKELINVYRRWGRGSLGLILTGNIMLDFNQLEAPGNAIIPPGARLEGERYEAFKELAIAAKAHGSLILGQVNHPGRQVPTSINTDPVSASDVQLEGVVMGMRFAQPHAASSHEILNIVARFTQVANFLHAAGFDGIELHAAHGYLLSQFLSPTTNKRKDQYGGSLQNRARIIVEIARSIRKTLPSSSGFILGIKVNSVEFQDDGFSPDEARELCRLLEEAEFDFVELSGGTYQATGFTHRRESTKKREAFFLDFAEKITPELSKTKAYVTGGFKTVGAMVDALKTVDGVGLGRPVCQEPDFVRRILNGEISGALVQKVDMDNFRLTNVVAGAQIRQLGMGQEPIDMSQGGMADIFMAAMDKWTKTLQSGNSRSYGYPELELDR